MSSRTLIMMGVAVLCGGAAAFMTKSWISGKEDNVTVLVARTKVTPWLTIKDPTVLFAMEQRPKTDAPEHYLSSYPEIVDRTTRKAIEPNKIVTADMLLDKDKETLDTMIKPGHVAATVSVTADKAVAGFVQAGTKVNIIHTVRTGDKDPEARPILNNVSILAVDQQPTPVEGGKPTSVPQTVTLELKPDDALKLEKAKSYGQLSLVLRAAGDGGEGDMKAEPKAEEKAIARTQPQHPGIERTPVERHVMMILNGTSVVRAVHTTRDGQTTTEIERTAGDVPPPAARVEQPQVVAPPVAPVPSQPSTLYVPPGAKKTVVRETTTIGG